MLRIREVEILEIEETAKRVENDAGLNDSEICLEEIFTMKSIGKWLKWRKG